MDIEGYIWMIKSPDDIVSDLYYILSLRKFLLWFDHVECVAFTTCALSATVCLKACSHFRSSSFLAIRSATSDCSLIDMIPANDNNNTNKNTSRCFANAVDSLFPLSFHFFRNDFPFGLFSFFIPPKNMYPYFAFVAYSSSPTTNREETDRIGSNRRKYHYIHNTIVADISVLINTIWSIYTLPMWHPVSSYVFLLLVSQSRAFLYLHLRTNNFFFFFFVLNE